MKYLFYISLTAIVSIISGVAILCYSVMAKTHPVVAVIGSILTGYYGGRMVNLCLDKAYGSINVRKTDNQIKRD